MKNQINKQALLDTISSWDSFLKRKVHLIACGGTALTLLNIKESTKDIDLIVPEIKEYEYLIDRLKELGYKPLTGYGWARQGGFIFDLFRGEAVYTTELLESPLKEGNHYLIKEFANIYLGVLNYYDIIITKLFRCLTADVEDCLALIERKGKEIDIEHLIKRYYETASYSVYEEKVNKNLKHFLKKLKENNEKQ